MDPTVGFFFSKCQDGGLIVIYCLFFCLKIKVFEKDIQSSRNLATSKRWSSAELWNSMSLSLQNCLSLWNYDQISIFSFILSFGKNRYLCAKNKSPLPWLRCLTNTILLFSSFSELHRKRRCGFYGSNCIMLFVCVCVWERSW